ncbi:nucleotide-binding protein [Cellulosimicrobium sp. TH-20]|uniref:nucleotide-binding protein n=1 Tax=Cellulosimicrobium sp. TH-20 TaxID=1980001 RepID=UPI001642A88F|nr:nucleotide-binding protein [Cellulosimicrobium sp. TH-20]
MSKSHVFIGSSSEALRIAKHLQVALDNDRDADIEATVWDQEIFGASQMTLQSLVEEAKKSDFAVLVLSPDDDVRSRDVVGKAPRDNVVFEMGLFMGVIGPERVFILPPKDGVKLPSDLGGFTLLKAYREREDGRVSASLTGALLDAVAQIKKLGPRQTVETVPAKTQRVAGQSAQQRKSAERAARGSGGGSIRAASTAGDPKRLEVEIDYICRAAEAQGWQVKTRSPEVLRLLDRNGNKYSFSIPERVSLARRELRPFARSLRANGLRVSSRVRKDL